MALTPIQSNVPLEGLFQAGRLKKTDMCTCLCIFFFNLKDEIALDPT